MRRYIGGQFTDFDPTKDQCTQASVQTVDAADPKRCQYRADSLAGNYSVTRSWGSAFKHDLTVGISAGRHIYTTNDLSVLTPAQRVAYDQTLVPVSDVAIGPYIEYHDYSSRFVDVLDFETLGLTENYRRGHEILLHVAPVSTALNSSRNYIDLFASGAYTVPFGDGLVRGVVQSNVEVTTGSPASTVPAGSGAGDTIPDGSIELALHIATPRFKIGRLVFDADFVDRYKDYLNAQSSLGGDSRLRGYPSGSFVGQNFVAANLEFRSRPFELLSVQFGRRALLRRGGRVQQLLPDPPQAGRGLRPARALPAARAHRHAHRLGLPADQGRAAAPVVPGRHRRHLRPGVRDPAGPRRGTRAGPSLAGSRLALFSVSL